MSNSSFDKRHQCLAYINLFKFINRNNQKGCEICSKSTIKTQERRQWCVFIGNFEPYLHFFSVSIVHFEK